MFGGFVHPPSTEIVNDVTSSDLQSTPTLACLNNTVVGKIEKDGENRDRQAEGKQQRHDRPESFSGVGQVHLHARSRQVARMCRGGELRLQPCPVTAVVKLTLRRRPEKKKRKREIWKSVVTVFAAGRAQGRHRP